MAVQGKTIKIISGDTDKHFRRSMVPFTGPKIQTPDISYCLERKAKSLNYGIMANAQRRCYTIFPKSEPYKNAETQTDYRESEAQTEPWEPPCKFVSGIITIILQLYCNIEVHKVAQSKNRNREKEKNKVRNKNFHLGHNPEMLTLAHLTWEHGLPAGIHEVHIINRMRIKRAWEAILPPMDTPENIKIRNSIIMALDIEEWAFRESEIQFIMDLRLDLMRNLLQNRESEYEKKMQGRFNRLENKLGKYRDNRIMTIRHNLKRDLRKLHRRHRDEQLPRKPDIIERHIDPKSDLYAPQMCFGEHPQRRHEVLEKRFQNKSYIEQEDTTLSWLPTIEKPKPTKRGPKPIDICIRETRWTEEKLQQLHSDLKAIRMKVKSVDEGPRLVKRNHEQPVTPRRSGTWDNTQKQREESATFIQKLVKGRAIQCLMYKGRDKCRELIEKLQSTEMLKQEDHIEEMQIIQQLQDDKSTEEDRLREIRDSLEGKTVCGTLDFLSKELVRLEDERRVHAFVLLAERERCMREAAEAGRRQVERNRRREFDEMFKQIVKVNQDSVEAYLEDIVREQIDWISDKVAKERILEVCNTMDAISKHAAENADKLSDEELVADMIYNFVLPEVEEHNIRKKIRDQQQNYMQNAFLAIYEKILDLPSESSIESSQVTNIYEKNDDIQMIYMTKDTKQDIEAEEIELSIYKTDIKNEKRANSKNDSEINSQSDSLMETR
ncbi:cilia- and flagella-associated protein 91 isoform X1 [Monomorium pharaonis]|uniref:cilia- and flagella-associated protein 91 isoform X1 n=1 Tax=Monomorium pharaonis TaxID=307658 RepID=UPI00102E198E|nr:cilia- and flagella-associated protein 91 isoform X1 [Monomorium pharaonis]